MENRFSDYVIPSTSTLKEALIKMTASHKGILLVADPEDKLLGILADGDVRRALINNASLSIPVEQIMNLNPVVAKSENEARQLLLAKPYLLLLPVIDEEGRLSGVLSGLNSDTFYRNDLYGDVADEMAEQEINKHKVLAIIPARGGSKRIPQKNLSRIGNESLLSLAIKAAQQARSVDYIFVSTDSEEIADEARKNNVEVPWLRPYELATDTAKSVDVMIHATAQFEKAFGYLPELIVLLEPTAPLRTSMMIDEAVDYFRDNKDADSLVAVNILRHNFHPEEVLKASGDRFITPYLNDRDFDSRKLRHSQDKAYVQNGLIYITRTEVLMQQNSIYGKNVLRYETSPELFCDIDDNEDLKLATFKIKSLS